MMNGFMHADPVATIVCGARSRCLTCCVELRAERKQFGQQIRQLIQGMSLSACDMIAVIYSIAAEQPKHWHSGWRLDQGLPANRENRQ